MRSYLCPSTHRRTSANIPSAGLRSVGRPPLSHHLPLVKSRMVPYHALSTCRLPCSEHLLNRLAAEPPPLSPTYIAPLATAPTPPAISWPSDHLPPACKAGKTLLLDAFKLSSMAVSYLLSYYYFLTQTFFLGGTSPQRTCSMGRGRSKCPSYHPPTPYTLSPLLKGREGGVKGESTPMCRVPSGPSS